MNEGFKICNQCGGKVVYYDLLSKWCKEKSVSKSNDFDLSKWCENGCLRPNGILQYQENKYYDVLHNDKDILNGIVRYRVVNFDLEEFECACRRANKHQQLYLRIYHVNVFMSLKLFKKRLTCDLGYVIEGSYVGSNGRKCTIRIYTPPCCNTYLEHSDFGWLPYHP